ncbi:MAG: sigma-70 family RNA polymerase sigma factor [Myxococcales bacterium]|nr:sigma-70 family RNA polymerase sigma factor [Myxococcales bacterium]
MLAVRMASTEVPTGLPAPPGDFAADAEALRPLVRAVAASVLREGRMHPDVEDCTNESLRRAIEGRDRLRPGEPLRPWLLGIARHVAMDALRARVRSRARLVQPSRDGSDDPLDRVADSTPDADERLDQGRRIAGIRAAMARLPEDQRRAIEMFHVEGLAYREIAAKLGVPIGSVCTWISRGRRSIADALGHQGKLA